MKRNVINRKLAFEAVFVDDGSPDGTAEVIEKIKEKFPDNVVLVKRKGKLGLGSAYEAGFLKSVGEFVVFMDADLGHHVKF